MEELPPEIALAVDTMKVGDVSKSFTFTNVNQKEVVAIVKLKSRSEGHKANLSTDYQTLKSMVEGEKQDAVLQKWLEKKIQDTYIRIIDNWKICDFQTPSWPVD
jgi:peptidyl-prolyl cis-trans isomerase SurA